MNTLEAIKARHSTRAFSDKQISAEDLDAILFAGGQAAVGGAEFKSLKIYAVQDHKLVAPAALSGGTMQQLYFAVRLAIIRLLWPDEPMPLFFDDAFAYYDKDRLTALLGWLNTNYTGHVFIFTCQNREAELLEDAGIPFEKIEL